MQSEIVRRILLALGISIGAKRAKATWPSFLKYYAIMKYQTAPLDMYVKFWLQFLNPKGERQISKMDFI